MHAYLRKKVFTNTNTYASANIYAHTYIHSDVGMCANVANFFATNQQTRKKYFFYYIFRFAFFGGKFLHMPTEHILNIHIVVHKHVYLHKRHPLLPAPTKWIHVCTYACLHVLIFSFAFFQRLNTYINMYSVIDCIGIFMNSNVFYFLFVFLLSIVTLKRLLLTLSNWQSYSHLVGQCGNQSSMLSVWMYGYVLLHICICIYAYQICDKTCINI